MGLGRHGAGPIGWWSPDPRGVLLPDGLRVSRSLRRSLRRFEVRVDTAFDAVVAACGDPRRPGALDHPADRRAPTAGCTAWAGRTPSSAGPDGRSPAGSTASPSAACSRGSRCSTASATPRKVALAAPRRTCCGADGDPRRLLDVQWRTDHLATLGVVEVPREDYLAGSRRRSQRRCPGRSSSRRRPPPASRALVPDLHRSRSLGVCGAPRRARASPAGTARWQGVVCSRRGPSPR